jgi:methyl-accepting chemotaxis protein
MNRFGLRVKLALGFGLLLTMLVAMGIVNYYSSLRVKAATDEVQSDQQKERHTMATNMALLKQIQSANQYVFNGDDASLQKYGAAKLEIEGKLAAIKKLLTTPAGKEMVSRFEESAKQVTALTEQEIAFRQASRNYEATDMAFSPKEEQAIEQMEEVAVELEARYQQRAQISIDTEHATERRGKFVMLGLVLGGVFIGTLAAVLIAGSIARSMTQMLGLAQEIASKNLNVADIEVNSKDEIGKTQSALNSMKKSLREMIHSIASDAALVSSASQQISSETQEIRANSEQTSSQAKIVSKAALQVTVNLDTVVAGATAMASTIESVAGNAQEAAGAATAAVKHTQAANVTVTRLGESSAEIQTVIKMITSIAQQTNLLAVNATTEAARADEAGKGFAVVAIEVKELAKETAQAIADASRKIETVMTAFQADAKTAAEIRQVIKVIASIAQQTNLLALNARIEAARAGEAGSKFAVVAREVKELAKQTGEAAEDISRKIEALRSDTKAAVEAITSIGGVINKVNNISSTIAEAVQEQKATTREMSRNLAEAAANAGEISKSIGDVAQAAEGTSTNAIESQKATTQLADISVELNALVAQFKIDKNESVPEIALDRPKSKAAAAAN